MNDQPFVFVSYSRDFIASSEYPIAAEFAKIDDNGEKIDSEKWVKFFVARLENRGIPVFFDGSPNKALSFKIGDVLPRVARDSILRCTVFIPILTPRYFQSNPCRIEWNTLWEHPDANSNGFVIPIRLGSFSPPEGTAESFGDAARFLQIYATNGVISDANFEEMVGVINRRISAQLPAKRPSNPSKEKDGVNVGLAILGGLAALAGGAAAAWLLSDSDDDDESTA